MVGPRSSHQFGKDEQVVDVYLEGSDSGESNFLIVIFIDEESLLIFDFRGFDEFVGDGIFDDDGVVDILFYFFFD